MSRNIVPRVDKGADLGTAEKNWNRLFADTVVLRGDDLRTLLNSKIGLNMLTAKGDILVATEPGVVTTLSAGASGYVLKSNPAAPEGLMWGPSGARQELTGDMTVTVGATGDFNTINAALENIVALYYPKYISGNDCPRVTIQLLPGFVMEENIVVESLDLSWITITGVDEETTIRRSAISNSGWLAGLGYTVFLVKNGGFLPIINQLFYMDQSGTATDTSGVMAYNNARAIITPGCGVRNASYTGLWALYNSIVTANGAIFSEAGLYGICADYNSMINANEINASGSWFNSIFATRGSIINAAGAYASDVSHSTYSGIHASSGSIINASGAHALNNGYAGIRSVGGSIVNAYNAEASGASYDIKAESGSIIAANNATVSDESKISPAPNTLTSSGIIFR